MNHLIAALQGVKRPKPKRPVQREHAFQKTVIDYCRLVLPPLAIITAIDHADQSPTARARRAKIGVLPGIPDVLIMWSPDPNAGLFVWAGMECKAPKGPVRVEQEKWRDAMLGQGAYWCAPRTLEDVAAFLATTPIPLRAVRL